MYVAVKGGERAIDNSHALLAEKRRGRQDVPELEVDQIRGQLGLSVDRVMAEGGLYDPELAAIAIKQARGDLVEAAFLIRAFRTTLRRFGLSLPAETGTMAVERRISAIYKDIPGGQVLGPTCDYTHRLLDFSLLEKARPDAGRSISGEASREDSSGDLSAMTRVADLLRAEGLLREEALSPTPSGSRVSADLTREPLRLPADRNLRLQALARSDEGFLLSMGYSFQRGYGGDRHPFAAEIRTGGVAVEFLPEELGFPVVIGELPLTECLMTAAENGGEERPGLVPGYGLSFGGNERKAMSMALVDLALCDAERKGRVEAPVQDQEFVLLHGDNVEASGFTSHLKLPHYVDFQSEVLELKKRQQHWDGMREEKESRSRKESA
jgi:alpha-D-ribose 1-methylphosphonate 5-triphosphate synthase subunit PhnI